MTAYRKGGEGISIVNLERALRKGWYGREGNMEENLIF
jgi:hypothetical protein